MTREEVKMLIKTIMTYYPNYHPDDLTATVDAWTAVFDDEEPKAVMLGLKRFIKTNTSGFAPSPGQILAMIPKNEKPEAAAWSETYKALCNGIYHAEEEFKKLDPIIQRAIGSADILKSWAQVDAEDGLTVIQSQFLKAYRTECKRAQVNDLQIGENKNNLLEERRDKE